MTQMSEEVRHLLRLQRMKRLQKSAHGISKLKAKPPDGGGPYILWVSGLFPPPLGRVVSLQVVVWDGKRPKFATDGWNSLPSFMNYLQHELSPKWKQIKEMADGHSRINPETGYRLGVSISWPMEEA